MLIRIEFNMCVYFLVFIIHAFGNSKLRWIFHLPRVNIGVCDWIDSAVHVYLFECDLVQTSTLVGIESILIKVIAYIFSIDMYI